MLTNGATTVASLSTIRDLIVPPLLCPEPEDYLQAMQAMGQTAVAIHPRTISAKIVQMQGPANVWAVTLPRILSGEWEQTLLQQAELDGSERVAQDIAEAQHPLQLERIYELEDLPLPIRWAAKAKACRMRFEAGQPLYIGIYEGLNRYRGFVPVLSFRGNGRYILGGREQYGVITAVDHPSAIDTAYDWYKKMHQREIAQMKRRVRRQSYPPLVVDVIAAILKTDDLLWDSSGSRVAWRNGGIHGHFGVSAPAWCYLFRGAPETAAKFTIVAQQEAVQLGVAAPFALPEQLYRYWGFTASGERALYAEGDIEARLTTGNLGDVYMAGELVGRVGLGQKAGNPLVQVKVKGGGHVVTAVPPNWQLTPLDLLAWGAYRTVKYLP